MNGRSVNKIWTDGRYSMRISDLNDDQLYQELQVKAIDPTPLALQKSQISLRKRL